ncbi:MAG: hypothetical protein PPP58_09965 [Natronomonas sp.]
MDGYFNTKSPELDELLGGGVLYGEGTLIKYHADGAADGLFVNAGIDVVDNMLTAVLLPRQSLSPTELEKYLEMLGASLDALLEHNQLFVLDTEDRWEERKNVFHVETLTDIQTATETALERSRARGTVHMSDVGAVEAAIGAADARTLRRWYQTDCFRGDRDFLLEGAPVHRLPDDLIEFYESMDRQVLDVEQTTGGDLRLTIEAAPDGAVGATRTLQFSTERPFVRIL